MRSGSVTIRTTRTRRGEAWKAVRRYPARFIVAKGFRLPNSGFAVDGEVGTGGTDLAHARLSPHVIRKVARQKLSDVS